MNIVVPPSYIIAYLERKLPDSKRAGIEYRVCSLLTEDVNYKLYVNTETGQWMDFKAHEGGNFFSLVAQLEGISYRAAKKMVYKQLWDSGLEFEEPKKADLKDLIVGKISDVLKEEIELFKPLTDLSQFMSGLERKAALFVKSRGLQPTKFMYADSGAFEGRLIIPYQRADGTIPYFQARTLVGHRAKYKNPGTRDYGVNASEVLFPYNEEGGYVIVVEGPIDAIVLQQLGFNATSIQGSSMSHYQARLLRGDRKVILSFDNDKAGDAGLKQARKELLKQRHANIGFVRPPIAFNDWNDFALARKPEKVVEYICRSISDDLENFVVSGLLE